MSQNTIPVVFATDENYVVPTYMAAYSLLLRSHKDNRFDIYIMIPDSMTAEGRNTLKRLEEIGNCAVSFLDMKDAFQNVKMLISYITPATYYRLLLAQLLPQYDVCLYLDSDIIVNHDLSDLMYVLSEKDYLAGVIAGNPPLSVIRGEKRNAHAQLLGIKSIETYVNAGLLVFNLKKIRDEDLTEKFLTYIDRGMPYQDQDILNAVCYGNIHFLPRKYNVCPLNRPSDAVIQLMLKEERKNVTDAYNNPYIIHYAMPHKPWLSRKFPMANFWWKFYDDLDLDLKQKYFDQFLKKNRKTAVKVKIKHSSFVMGVWEILKKLK